MVAVLRLVGTQVLPDAATHDGEPQGRYISA